MILPAPIQDLINALSRLPGVGPKTASRLTFYLLRALPGRGLPVAGRHGFGSTGASGRMRSEESPADRIAGFPTARRGKEPFRRRDAEIDPTRPARQEPIGRSGPGVLLLEGTLDPQHARCHHHRRRNVAAGTEHDIRPPMQQQAKTAPDPELEIHQEL